MAQKQIHFYTPFLMLVFFFTGCGEEYFSTPEKTIQHYVKNKTVGSMTELEACLGSFRKEDKQWYEANSAAMCFKLYGMDCPGDKVSQQTTVWTDRFEPRGPNKGEITASDVDEKGGRATLTVDGIEIEMVKERGNWKIKGFFGAQEDMENLLKGGS